VEVRELDGEALDDLEACSFDAVISRVGLIYFPDQRRALHGIHRVLRTGGRVSAIVYSTAERNPFFSIPVTIIRRIAALPAPAPGTPGPFSLGGPNVLEAAYEDAGFEDVHVAALDAPVRFESAAECVRLNARHSAPSTPCSRASAGPTASRPGARSRRSFGRSKGAMDSKARASS
jgi:SAM-dependent methyltransferase